MTATVPLHAPSTGGLSANNGAGYDGGTGIWTITGTVAQVNTALENLVFNPNTNNDVNTTIGVNIDDGNEDLGGALTGTISLNVTPVNDAPTADDSTVFADEDIAYVFDASDFGYSDIESDPLNRIRITSLESSGSLQLDGVDVVLNQVITRADIDADKLKFTGALNEYGTGYDSFDYQVHD